MQGGRVFEQAACGRCHTFSTYWQGNGLAPDLTGVASIYSRDFILESILEPNGRFYHTEYRLKDGNSIRGSLVEIRDGQLVIAPVMMAPEVTTTVPQADVISERPSKISPMPEGLLDTFTREQILDLLAFLDAGGDPEAPIYRRK
jgi:putative heme-binding domain-containing protein